MIEKIEEAADFIREKTGFEPELGLILGTGLGALADEIDAEHVLEYEDIPHFPVSTVESHHGRLILGTLGGKKVVAMQGRFHYYEGYTMQEVTFPVRVMKWLGISHLFLSNACGSVNTAIKTGDLMLISDHLNLLPENPLRGKHDPRLGPRFPDMAQTYDRKLLYKAREIAQKKGIEVHTGVYASVQGPNLETQAEYRWLRTIGADVVGMSTIPEVIVARQMSIKCFAISVITDEGWHDPLEPVTIEDVIAAANGAEPHMTAIMKELITQL